MTQSDGYLSDDIFLDKIKNIPVIENIKIKKTNNIKILEDCKINFKKSRNYILKKQFNKILKQINFLIYSITLLKSKIIVTSDKEMKTYFSKYKNIIHIFIKNIKNILCKRDGNYFLINNLIYINSCTCKHKKAAYRNLNSVNNNSIKILYSIPGITIHYNTKNYKLQFSIMKSKYILKSKMYNTYNFVLTSNINIKNNKISKKSFLNIIDDIYNFKYSKLNNINELIEFINDEIHELNTI